MSAKLKIKRGTTTSWADSANKDTTLEPGQLGVEYLDDGNMRLKVGRNGVELISSSTYHGNGDTFDFGISVRASYQLTFDGTQYHCVGKYSSAFNYNYIGNLSIVSLSSDDDTGEPFCIQADGDNNACSLFLSDTYAGAGHAIQLTKVSEDWSELPYVTPSTSVYQDNMLTFSKPMTDSTFTIMGKLTGTCKLLQKTSVTNASSIVLQVNSTASSTSGAVNLNSYCNDGVPSFYGLSNTRLGYPNQPWIEGYITDIYTNRLHVNTDSYGPTIPTSGSEGQLFFQIYS